MLKNYLKLAWRNISSRRSYATLNIVGLSVGIAFLQLVGIYAWTELRVNHDLKNNDNQYIIQSNGSGSGTYDLTTAGALAKSLKDLYPELISNYYRWDGVSSNVSKGNKIFREDIQIGDSTLLSMYGFPLLYGNAGTALNDPYAAVITEETAVKYFGRKNVVGETISIGSFSGTKHDFLISGVLSKVSRNSIISINDANRNNIFLSEGCIGFFGRIINSWANPWIVNYIELKPGVHVAAVEKIMTKLIKQNAPVDISEQIRPILVPLNTYYLSSNNSLVKKMLSTLTIIALFILFMAVVNFINIAVSQASSRMKEIGVRKVLGSLRRQLILQFLAESLLLVFIATILSMGMYEFFRPAFNHLLDADIPSALNLPISIYLFLLLLVAGITLLAGFYPALILSSLKPVEVIRGKGTGIKTNVFFRNLLFVFQFSIASIVLIAAIVITKQVNLFLNGDLGYDKSFIVSAQVPRDWTGQGTIHMETVRNEFSKLPMVENATLSYEIPDGNIGDVPNAFKPGEDSTKAVPVFLIKADADYLSTYKIPLAAGSFFSAPSAESELPKMVLNETAAKTFGWATAGDAIGKQLKLPAFGGTIFTIAGVTKDFQFGSMQSKIFPTVFIRVDFANQYRFLSFRLKTGNINKSLAALQKRWSFLLPGSAFEYEFMDDRLKKMYKTEIQLRQAAYIATILAAVIVLLGVFGLVSLNIEKRRKEIGIRKILGSSVSNIISIFVKEYLLIIVIAGFIACPPCIHYAASVAQ